MNNIVTSHKRVPHEPESTRRALVLNDSKKALTSYSVICEVLCSVKVEPISIADVKRDVLVSRIV